MNNATTRLGLLALALLAGCASVPQAPEEAVAKRAQARYDALIAKDYKEAYTYFTPAFRDANSYDSWIRSRPPRAAFLSARVLKVECPTQDACSVEMETSYESPRGVRAAPKGPVERVTPERWVQVDGQWWLFQAR